MTPQLVRAARIDDVPAMARVHVLSWAETYRGVMSDAVLDDPDAVAARERFWTAALTDPRYADNRVQVAEAAEKVVGIAMSGPPSEADAHWSRQLYVLYVLAEAHGIGLGAALLDAVLEPGESAVLWVADPNPRAQAFYRKKGFRPDGTEKLALGVREIQLVREVARRP